MLDSLLVLYVYIIPYLSAFVQYGKLIGSYNLSLSSRDIKNSPPICGELFVCRCFFVRQRAGNGVQSVENVSEVPAAEPHFESVGDTSFSKLPFKKSVPAVNQRTYIMYLYGLRSAQRNLTLKPESQSLCVNAMEKTSAPFCGSGPRQYSSHIL